MATTIRDLLHAADAELIESRARAASPSQARDAAGVIAAAARITAHLAVDGLDRYRDGPRKQAAADLVAACERVGDHGGRTGRATALIGGAGDAIASLRRDSTTADRWALCVSVAPLTRTAATVYAATGPTRTPPTLRTVLHQATAIARLAVLDPPEARDLAIQDHPIPSTTLTTGLSPLRY
jgi:hypothetical protein